MSLTHPWPSCKGSIGANGYAANIDVDGTTLWSKIVPGYGAGTPVVGSVATGETEVYDSGTGTWTTGYIYADYIYIAGNSALYAYDASTSDLKWSYSFDFTNYIPADISDGGVLTDVKSPYVDPAGNVWIAALRKCEFTIKKSGDADPKPTYSADMPCIVVFHVSSAGALITRYGPYLLGSYYNGSSPISDVPDPLTGNTSAWISDIAPSGSAGASVTFVFQYYTLNESSGLYDSISRYGEITTASSQTPGTSGRQIEAASKLTLSAPSSSMPLPGKAVQDGLEAIGLYKYDTAIAPLTPDQYIEFCERSSCPAVITESGTSYNLDSAQVVACSEQVWDAVEERFVRHKRWAISAANKILLCDQDLTSILDTHTITGNAYRGMGIISKTTTIDKPGGTPGETVSLQCDILVYTTDSGKMGSIPLNQVYASEFSTYAWETSIPLATDATSVIATPDGHYVGHGSNLTFIESDNSGSVTVPTSGTVAPYLATTTAGGILYVNTSGSMYLMTARPNNFIIVSTTPAHNATGQDVDATVEIVFNSAPDAATFTGETATMTYERDGETINIDCEAVVDGFKVTMTPADHLASNTIITVTLDGACANVDGGTLGSDTRFSFSTTAQALVSDYIDEVPVIAPTTAYEKKPWVQMRVPAPDYSPAQWNMHVKLQSYDDAGGTSLIESKDTQNNVEDFEFSIDDGKSWWAFPASGIPPTAYGCIVRCRMDCGLTGTTKIKASVGAEDN
jgi:hypothetical protein